MKKPVKSSKNILERDLEKKFGLTARKAGFLYLKFEPVGERGWPDRILISPAGTVGFMEWKKPGSGVMSPWQKKRIAQLTAQQVSVVVVDREEQAEEFLQKMIDRSLRGGRLERALILRNRYAFTDRL